MSWRPIDESGKCVVDGFWNGTKYEEISCLYPFLHQTLFKWEREWNPQSYRDWMQSNLWFPIVTCSFYLLAIYYGQKYFEKRPKWNLKGTLAMWNLGLALFSALGFFRLMPQLLHNLSYYKWNDNLCYDANFMIGTGPSDTWCFLFAISKFPELIDTFFIVVHKKPLMLLHWYHHVSVLFCCWLTYADFVPVGVIFATMNFGIHMVMYTYYFLMAIHAKPRWFKAYILTMSQILQMVVGVVVSCNTVYLKLRNVDCKVPNFTLGYYVLMYASYLYLFVRFFGKKFGVGVEVKKKPVQVKMA